MPPIIPNTVEKLLDAILEEETRDGPVLYGVGLNQDSGYLLGKGRAKFGVQAIIDAAKSRLVGMDRSNPDSRELKHIIAYLEPAPTPDPTPTPDPAPAPKKCKEGQEVCLKCGGEGKIVKVKGCKKCRESGCVKKPRAGRWSWRRWFRR